MNAKSESSRAASLAVGGSVLAAIVASACCWLPLLLLVFGVSAAGVSATFEKARPLFLGVTAVLLAAGFYLSYFRKEKCAPGTACEMPNAKLRRLNRTMLWVATVAVVGFALFPNYIGLLLGGGDTVAIAEEGIGSEVILAIEGMTCEGCAVHIKKALLEVDGVKAANVSYGEKAAHVIVDTANPPTRDALGAAVEKAGYALRRG